jgi:hypothetical protein
MPHPTAPTDRRQLTDRRVFVDRRSGVDRRSRQERRVVALPVELNRRSSDDRRHFDRRMGVRRSRVVRRLLPDRRQKANGPIPPPR